MANGRDSVRRKSQDPPARGRRCRIRDLRWHVSKFVCVGFLLNSFVLNVCCSGQSGRVQRGNEQREGWQNNKSGSTLPPSPC